MSRQISCGFKILDKLGVRIKKIKNTLLVGFFENFWVNSLTCLELHSYKKIVVHIFIPMLLLPLTHPLIHLKLKKMKGPKMDSLHFHFHFTFHKHGGRSIAGIKESFKGKYTTCKTSRGMNLQRISI